jgi:hypothetical protein
MYMWEYVDAALEIFSERGIGPEQKVRREKTGNRSERGFVVVPR